MDLRHGRLIAIPGTIDLATAYELAAQWHDKHSRGAREIAEDFRVGKDIQEKALVASQHHAASAAGLRLAAIDIRRKAL